MWAMVNMMSMFRMMSDMPAFILHWEQLEKVFNHVGYEPHPWTMYWIAVCLSGPNNCGNMNWIKSPVVRIGSNTGHMPYDSNWVTIDEVKWMQRWKWDNLKDGYARLAYGKEGGLVTHPKVPSMYREFCKHKSVEYYGREAFYTGRLNKEDNWIAQEAAARGIEVLEEVDTSVSFNQYLAVYGRPPPTKRSIDLFSFIDEVIIPNKL
jgi:hypothetical protein